MEKSKVLAFTLAEVLITLGIIGVVAAITIPGLIQKNFEKRVVSQLKETQSILSQAVRMAEEEYGDVEGWDLKYDSESTIKIAQYLKPFLKIAVDCGVDDTEGKCIKVKQYQQIRGTVDDYSTRYRTNDQIYKIVLNNGSAIWFVSFANYNNNYLIGFYIDVNGKSKPNTIGEDLFYFEYGEKALRPMGAPDSAYPYETHCKNKQGTGWGCAYYIATHNDMNYLH